MDNIKMQESENINILFYLFHPNKGWLLVGKFCVLLFRIILNGKYKIKVDYFILIIISILYWTHLDVDCRFYFIQSVYLKLVFHELS